MSKNRYLLTKLDSKFTKTPNELHRLGPVLSKDERRIYPYAIGVYLVLAGSAEDFHPGVRHWAKYLGCSKNTVQKALLFLIKRGLIKDTGTKVKQRTVYSFVAVAKWIGTRSASPKGQRSSQDETHLASSDSGHKKKYKRNNKKLNIINPESEEWTTTTEGPNEDYSTREEDESLEEETEDQVPESTPVERVKYTLAPINPWPEGAPRVQPPVKREKVFILKDDEDNIEQAEREYQREIANEEEN